MSRQVKPREGLFKIDLAETEQHVSSMCRDADVSCGVPRCAWTQRIKAAEANAATQKKDHHEETDRNHMGANPNILKQVHIGAVRSVIK